MNQPRLILHNKWIDVYAAAAQIDKTSEDDFLFHPIAGGGFRLAVLDGMTPLSNTEPWPYVNTALYAVALIRGLLRTQRSITEVLSAANKLLYQPGLMYRQGPGAAVVVVDICEDQITIVQAGDCGAWVRTAAGWQEPFVADCFNQKYPWDLKWQGQEANKIFDHEHSNWTSTPVGAFEDCLFAQATYQRQDIQQIVIASDGAQFNPQITDLQAHWQQLRAMELASAHERSKIHDDVCLIDMRLDKL